MGGGALGFICVSSGQSLWDRKVAVPASYVFLVLLTVGAYAVCLGLGSEAMLTDIAHVSSLIVGASSACMLQRCGAVVVARGTAPRVMVGDPDHVDGRCGTSR